MKKVLIIHDNFFLGDKSGGPYNSVKNLYKNLIDYFQVDIFTQKEPISNYSKNEFNIIYGKRISLENYDCIILNSFFSLNLFKILISSYGGKIVVLPRGELMSNVINKNVYKYCKKHIFILIFRIFYLLKKKKIIFGGTNNFEIEEIDRLIGGVNKLIVPNIGRLNKISDSFAINYSDKLDTLTVLFFSRVDTKKNLEFTLKLLYKSYRKIKFDIYGEARDIKYENELRKIALFYASDKLIITFYGHVHFDDLFPNTKNYHLMMLHSFGENFSHSIFEMFFLGIPCLISDNTPWKNLKDLGLGWDLPLEIDLHLNIINNFELNLLELNLNKQNRTDYLNEFLCSLSYEKLINYIK